MNPHTAHIILIGFMGCGKSTVGKELAKMLKRPLIDTDAEIEKSQHKKISTIFTEVDESGFRDIETSTLKNISQNLTAPSIISCGGGIILRPENTTILRTLGTIIWLRADANLIYERTRKNKQRPILQTENPKQIITDLLAQRTPLYQQTAHITIDVQGLNSQELAIGVIESVRYHTT